MCVVLLHVYFINLYLCSRYDRFQDAFEHVSTVIDDIYKVHVSLCVCMQIYMYVHMYMM